MDYNQHSTAKLALATVADLVGVHAKTAHAAREQLGTLRAQLRALDVEFGIKRVLIEAASCIERAALAGFVPPMPRCASTSPADLLGLHRLDVRPASERSSQFL